MAVVVAVSFVRSRVGIHLQSSLNSALATPFPPPYPPPQAGEGREGVGLVLLARQIGGRKLGRCAVAGELLLRLFHPGVEFRFAYHVDSDRHERMVLAAQFRALRSE